MPFFSVIIPVHNRAHLIEECLTSVLAQTDQDFEVIVVDNNSTDDLMAALKMFTDPRVRIIPCTTPGPAAARNAGVSQALGRYLSFLDSDDLWSPDVLQSCREHVETGAAVVYLTASTFQHGQMPVRGEIPKQFGHILHLIDIGGAVGMGTFGTGLMAAAQRNLFQLADAFDESLFVAEDFDWAMRHLRVGPVVILGDMTRLSCRLHEVNICKNVKAYLHGTSVLVRKCLSDVYSVSCYLAVRKHTILMLVGSASNIARWGRPGAALYLYIQLLRLGFRWRQLNHVLIPQVLRSWLFKRLNLK